ncbi:MAG: 4-phosphoerythronate dehydrogenase [Ignavibacteriaceae bacterium]|nr:4-phosphoerythronate dehydrogenase [Ignavibacteriaceae bacterium]
MKIVVDENVAFAEEAFSKFGEVRLLHGREIDKSVLKDADALIVRSITKINRTLLEGTSVSFVGTATIGTDHVDLDYLLKNSIGFADAKGCNADAVAEYVFTALFSAVVKQNISLKDKTIGIVGVGNIGSRIVKLAEAYGLKALMNDPPRQKKESNPDFVSLEEILTADIITIHTPLTYEGDDKTFHLFNENNLRQIKEGTIFINASRGEVVDNTALSDLLDENKFTAILDVWENEPNIDQELIKKVLFTTPHVAGYSLEGKINGTKMMIDAMNKFFNKNILWQPQLLKCENAEIEISTSIPVEEILYSLFNKIYNIDEDSNRLKNFSGSDKSLGKYFDLLRKEYPFRREFTNYSIKADALPAELWTILKAFRFNH